MNVMRVGCWFLLFLGALSPASRAMDDAAEVAAKIVGMAKDLRKQGQHDAADKMLRDAAAECEAQLRRQPDDALARFGLALLQVQIDQVAEAGKNLDRAMQLQPNNAAMHAFKGQMHGVDKEWRKALVPLRRAVELNPAEAGYRMLLAMCLSNLQEHQEAVAQAREATRLEPNSTDRLIFYSLMLIGAGDFDAWEKTMQAAVEAHPKDIELRDSLVHGYFVQNRPEQAYRECLELQKLDPANVEIDQKLVLYATQAKRPLAAEQHLGRLRELRKGGKFAKEKVLRDHFFVGTQQVLAGEYLEPDGDVFTRFVFYVVDEEEKEKLRISLFTSAANDKALREAGRIGEGEQAYVLMSQRGDEVQFYGTYRALPAFDQVRAVATEIIEGKRQPNAQNAKAEPVTPTTR